MKPQASLLSFLALAGSTLFAISYTHAADATWNVNADGDWANAGSWNPAAAPGATTGTTSTDVATFGTIINAARAITVDAERNIFGINFAGNSSAYNLGGGNILLTNGGTIQTSGAGSGHTDTIASAIAIQGDGGSASFTGGSSTATRLLVINGAVTGVSTPTKVTTLNLNGTNTGNNAVNGNIGDGSGGGKLALVKSGDGRWNLGGTNTYSGGTTISGGRLLVANDESLGATSGGITFTGTTGAMLLTTGMTLNANRTITSQDAAMAVFARDNVNNTGTFGIAGQLTGDGGFQFSNGYQLGSGTFNVTNLGNDFKGVLRLGGDYSGPHTFTPSSLTVNIASLTDAVGFGNIQFGRGNGSSANTLTLAWSNTANSALVLNNRRIELDMGTETSVLANNNSNTGRTVTVNTDLLISRAGDKTFTLGGSNIGANAFNGLIANSTTPSAIISLSKTGGGTWAVTNDNNSFTGTTSITGGILSISSIANLSSNSAVGAPTTEANGRIIMGTGNTTGTLLYTGATATTDRTIQINSSNNNNTGGATIQNDGSGALTFKATTFNNAYTLGTENTRILTLSGSHGGTIEGEIQDNSGAGLVGVTKSGNGTWTLSGANTYGGPTLVNGGTLVLAGSNNSAGVTTVTTGTLHLGSGSNGGLASGNLNLNNDAAVVQAINADRTIANNGIMNANPTFTGNYSLSMGNLRVNNGPRTITNDIAAGKSLTVASIDRDGTNNRNLVVNGSGDTTVIGAITLGTGSLTKNDGGTLTLDGTNAYTGATSVNAGTLIINGSTSSTSLVTVASGATLGGIGNVGGNTTLNGTLSPGENPGTLTFGGNLTVNNGATYFFEGGDLTDVFGTLGLNDNWTLALGGGLKDGGSVTIFTYGTLASSPDLVPTFDITGLGFAPSSTLSLTDTGSGEIVLNGVSVIPEPRAALLGGIGILMLLRRRR